MRKAFTTRTTQPTITVASRKRSQIPLWNQSAGNHPRLASQTTLTATRLRLLKSSPVLTSIRSLRPTLPAALLAVTSLLTFPSRQAHAQAATVIQHPYPIGLDHDMATPYNFTGRVFDNENFAFGSGTLIRRHTILTAGHVVYDPTTGFTNGITFSRALYGTYSLSKSQASAVDVLTGYQAAATTAGAGNESLASGARDLGYVLTNDAPIDDDWGNYLALPSALTDNSGRFVLGYPGVSFNGRTMTYIVPMTPFVEVGTIGSGFFQNEEFSTEPGNSGGPVYSVQNGQQYIVGELTSGLSDSSGEFNASYIRAIDKDADQLLTSAEYTSGLISGITLKGPATVTARLDGAYQNQASVCDGFPERPPIHGPVQGVDHHHPERRHPHRPVNHYHEGQQQEVQCDFRHVSAQSHHGNIHCRL